MTRSHLATSSGADSAILRLAVALGPALLLAAAALLMDPIAQPLSYHAFHDGRTLFGIPNFFNVASNALFLFVGGVTLNWLRRNPASMPAPVALAYNAMALGLIATAFGSSYYHWAPDNAAMVWDRLPIALTAMALFAGFLIERLRLDARMAHAVLWTLIAYGVGAVLYWHWADDLRFYFLAQFYPLLAIPVLMYVYPAAYSHNASWLVALAFYVLAKIFEHLDGFIYGFGSITGGHMLKHVAAAMALYWIYRMLKLRTPLEPALPRRCEQDGGHALAGGGLCRAPICNCY